MSFIESLESRTFLSASPDVIAADRAAIRADQVQIAQLIKQKATTFAADHKDLVAALLAKAKNAGLLRRDLVQQALTLGKTLVQHRHEWQLQIHEKQLEINDDRHGLTEARGHHDENEVEVHQSDLLEHQSEKAALMAEMQAQTKTDLQAIRDAFKSVEPQIKAFLANAQPEIDQLKADLAANRTNYQQLIQQAREQLQADRLKLHDDLKA
jgi:hypothetical protein